MSDTTTDCISLKWVIDECDSTDETSSFAYIDFHLCGARLHTYEGEVADE